MATPNDAPCTLGEAAEWLRKNQLRVQLDDRGVLHVAGPLSLIGGQWLEEPPKCTLSARGARWVVWTWTSHRLVEEHDSLDAAVRRAAWHCMPVTAGLGARPNPAVTRPLDVGDYLRWKDPRVGLYLANHSDLRQRGARYHRLLYSITLRQTDASGRARHLVAIRAGHDCPPSIAAAATRRLTALGHPFRVHEHAPRVLALAALLESSDTWDAHCASAGVERARGEAVTELRALSTMVDLVATEARTPHMTSFAARSAALADYLESASLSDESDETIHALAAELRGIELAQILREHGPSRPEPDDADEPVQPARAMAVGGAYTDDYRAPTTASLQDAVVEALSATLGADAILHMVDAHGNVLASAGGDARVPPLLLAPQEDDVVALAGGTAVTTTAVDGQQVLLQLIDDRALLVLRLEGGQADALQRRAWPIATRLARLLQSLDPALPDLGPTRLRRLLGMPTA